MIYVFAAAALTGISSRAIIPKADRLFWWTFYVSTIYYGVLGPWYWLKYQHGVFLGIDWTTAIIPAAWDYLVVAWIVLGMLWLYRGPNRPAHGLSMAYKPHMSQATLEAGLLAIGGAGALYVVKASSSFRAGQTDGIFQIAYQVSDVLVPVILFRVAKRGWSPSTIALAVSFTSYAIFAGLRYKLAILFLPLGCIGLDRLRSRLVRRTVILTFASVTGGGFALLTSLRSKFSGINITQTRPITHDFFYGLFAETNIIYGWIAIRRAYGIGTRVVLLEPLRASLFELVPRAILGTKNNGSYLGPLYDTLGGPIAVKSGTAYPFFGEYFVMGGMPALFFLVLGYIWLYRRLRRTLDRLAGSNGRLQRAADGLLAVIFGYYYYSRGYSPQALKGMLSTVLPFYWLLRLEATEQIGPSDDAIGLPGTADSTSSFRQTGTSLRQDKGSIP